MKYRPEINGLRAFAVVPVILFHAGFELFSGGFIGVDVFFVISGYLITNILIEDIENNRFSFVKFYEQRARRILPALFFVMLVCIPFAWMWMLPDQLKAFSQSIVATSLFVSNVLFWKKSGYFDVSSEEKPLIHTWSLAVEEQYYLLFPIFLFLMWRFGKNRVFWTIVALAIISLAISEWGWRNAEIPNFYLAPSRAWEIFAGSIAAFTIQKYGVRKNNILSLIGLAAILFSIFAYDERTPFPSVYALVPVVGTVLLVLFADKETLVAKILSAKVFVGIGLISYSAYLWHQPLFAFSRLNKIEQPSMMLMSVYSCAVIVLAIISWKFVEQPFRKKRYQYIERKPIFVLSSIAVIMMVLIGYIGHYTNGAIKIRFSPQQIAILKTAEWSPLRSKCHFPQKERSLNRTECEYFGKKSKFAVFGNSHSTELAYALAKVLEPYQIAIKHHTISGCMHNYNVIDEKNTICQRWHDIVLKKLNEDTSIKTVILSYANKNYLHEEKYRKSLIKMTKVLLEARKKVILVLQAPIPDAHINKYLVDILGNMRSKIIGTSLSSWNHTYSSVHKLLTELPDEVTIVNPADYFCKGDECFVARDGIVYYFDDSHMSIGGANIISKALLLKLNIK